MSLAPFDSYCAAAADQHQMRRWVLRAIILSLAIHAGLLVFFWFTKVESFRFAEAPAADTPRMLWRMTELPEIPAEESKIVPWAGTVSAAPSPIPVAKPEADLPEVPLRPAALILPEGGDAPLAGIGGVDEGAGKDTRPRAALENLIGRTDGLLTDALETKKGVVLQGLAEPKDVGSGAGDSVGSQVRQSLDKILEQSGPLPVGEVPIVDVPGGALYEYNSYTLLPEAIVQLRKLGELIRRNPRAIFSIEGHTDATGAPEYNQMLSEQRAESVKEWLVMEMGIDPQRIETRGFGSSRLLVPADRSIEEQQPNRRVEIVIKNQR